MAVTLEQFLDNLSNSGLLAADMVAACLDDLPADQQPQDARSLAKVLVRDGKLTKYQAQIIYQGRQNQLKFGEYTVLDKIGAGGMGVVLKARHRRMKRKVAIKVLPIASMQDQEAIDRFYREVEAAAKLMHTNIVTAHDAGEYEGMHYLVMEYVDGEDLSEIIRHHGPLPIQQAVECIIQTARGLEYAHRHGVVHRDIKPANLLLAKDGTVKILDMGLARLSSSVGESLQSERPQLTQSGQMMGTVDYMSPEQATDTRHADHRSDIYSLGCTLYRLLTGDNVYAGRTVMKKLMAHQEKPIPLISDKRADVKPSLDAVFQKMLAKEPQQRQQSMGEVIAELEAAMSPDAPPRRRVRDEPSSDSALTEFFANIGAAKKVALVTKQPATGMEETIDCQPEKEDTSNRMIPLDRSAVSREKSTATVQQPTEVLAKKKWPERLFQKRIVWAVVGVGVLILVALLGMRMLLTGGSPEPEPETSEFAAAPPPLAVAPFDAATAKSHQQAWADYLGVPVEREIDIPGGEKLVMVLIPPGEFLMGSTEAEQARFLPLASPHGVKLIPSEGPQHPVRITKPFWLGKYEVTQAQWQAVMGDNPSEFKDEFNDSPLQPVELVSWEMTQEFLKKLNENSAGTGLKFLLPTEAQWEYACRAGTTTFWHCGDSEEVLEDYSWFAANSGKRTHPVGELLPNGFGLYDMHGNVWEWCEDWFAADHYASLPEEDPLGPPTGSDRVFRGGFSGYPPWLSRSAYRSISAMGMIYDCGFRVVAVPVEK